MPDTDHKLAETAKLLLLLIPPQRSDNLHNLPMVALVSQGFYQSRESHLFVDCQPEAVGYLFHETFVVEFEESVRMAHVDYIAH